MSHNLDFQNVDMDDFDFDNFFTTDTQTVRKSTGCRFKECIQVGVDGGYFCSFHNRLVFAQDDKTGNKNEMASKEQGGYKACAAVRCRKEQAQNAYLCVFHDLSVQDIQVIKEYKCKTHKCNRVKTFENEKCIIHT